MTIYIDLDETLIHAIYAQSGNPGKRTPIRLLEDDGLDSEIFYSLLRPKAKELLSFCREASEVKMLTTATKDYALKHNEVFSLGFKKHEIIAREDYLYQSMLAYGTVTELLKTRVDPNSLLIDNLPRLAEAAMLKQQYLGIKPHQYIQIREFSGKDPQNFNQELIELQNQIKETITKHKEAKAQSIVSIQGIQSIQSVENIKKMEKIGEMGDVLL